MGNLLKAEFYKMFHGKSFWGIVLFSLVLGSIMMLDLTLPASAAECFYSCLYNLPLLYFLIIIWEALFIGEEFGNRCVNACIGAGYKRASLLAGKIISCLTGSLIILLAPLLAAAAAGVLFWGKPEGFAGTAFLGDCVIIIAAIMAMGSLTLFAAFVFRDVGKTLTIMLALFFVMIFILNGERAMEIAQVLPIGQLRLLSQGQLHMPYTLAFLTDIFWIAAGCSGAYLAFFKADLK